MTQETFLTKARNKHGYKYTYLNLSNRITLTSKIEIEFGGIIYLQTVSKHLLGKCPEKTTNKKSKEQFIEHAIKVWGERFDYSDVVYKNALSKIKIFDNSRNVWIEQIASLHLKGFEPKFFNTEIFIIESKLISDYLYTYNSCEYINKSTNLTITCPHHGDFSVKPFNHLNYGECCNKCDKYYYNKKVIKFLNSKNILFLQEYKFQDCKNIYLLPFDFFIPSMRTVIEFDSIKNFQPISLDAYKHLKINDKIKNDYCEENYINLIRIRHDQIDNIGEIIDDLMHIK